MKRKLNVAIIGLGYMGTPLLRQLQRYTESQNVPIKLVTICDKEPQKYADAKGVTFTNSYRQVIESDNVDIVVEAVGGTNSAYDIISGALDMGKHVVTNNRVLLATQGERLFRIAQDKGAHIACSSALLGGLPSLDYLTRGSVTVTDFQGVLSSSCNYILMRMQENGESVEEALKAAVELGYTEPNPQLDLSGKDSLYKLIVLRAMLFGVWSNAAKIKPVGIENLCAVDVALALQFGYRIKLVGSANCDAITLAPYLVDDMSLLGRLQGGMTGFSLCTQEMGHLFMSATSASKDAVATAMLNDILSIAYDKSGITIPAVSHAKKVTPHEALPRYFVRCPQECRQKLQDKPQIRILDERLHEVSGLCGLVIETGIPYVELSSMLKDDDTIVLNILTE